jgi:spore germination cell wall hydrolase CwlJ-like protein
MKEAPEDFIRELEADVMARTLWGEARGEGDMGMHAVANVILNRVAVAQARGRFWWGDTIIDVCQKPFQFSCWNKNDPNLAKIQNVDMTDIHFMTALRLARRAVIGALPDITNNATHYHERSITPNWARGKTPCAAIGRHVFYRILD